MAGAPGGCRDQSFTMKARVSKGVHLWVPDLSASRGGIQAFSGFLLRALEKSLAGNIRVLSKHDVPLTADGSASGVSLSGTGRWPVRSRTAAFAALLLHKAFRERPSLVITTHVNFAVVARFLKRYSGIPYAVVAHGIEVWGLARRDRIAALHDADQVWAVSRCTRNRLLDELRLKPEKVKLLPNTFDSDRFAPGSKPGHLLERHALAPGARIILTVTRLPGAERNKGYDQILKALPQVRASLPDAHYILAGSGPDRPRIERLVGTLNLKECVTLAGFVADQELCDYYNLCDVFAMPSKGEGFGIVFLEALASGRPVLAGCRDGSVDAVLDGELGVLVDPDNVPEIAGALIRILKKQHPLSILYQPERLRTRVIEEYGFERFKQRLAGLLAAQDFNVSGRLFRGEPVLSY